MGVRRAPSAPGAQCDREEYLRVSLIKSCVFVQHSGLLRHPFTFAFTFVHQDESVKQGVSGERSGVAAEKIFVCFVD